MYPLGCLLAILGIVLALGLSLLNIVRTLLGFPPKARWFTGGSEQRQQRQNHTSGQSRQSADSRRKKSQKATGKPKVFDDNEGEYVDYEEVK